jgi:AraC-like DNA-binding protein
MFQNNQKKKYKKKFEEIINIQPVDEIVNEIGIKQHSKKEFSLSSDLLKDITEKLKKFEKDKLYKNSNVSIQNLAKEFNTNTKYLSLVINEYKSKTFINYVNDLRVDNIIIELKQNKNLLKYTVVALAEEAGFNTAESFSNAFYKRTGIKPSFFVKELSKM